MRFKTMTMMLAILSLVACGQGPDISVEQNQNQGSDQQNTNQTCSENPNQQDCQSQR